VREREPGGGENSRRGSAPEKPKKLIWETNRDAEQGLEGGVTGSGSRLAGEQKVVNTKGATKGDEPGRLRSGRNPWTSGEPCTW